ncbi:MAG TPA: selenocysteine-specific translation elongation factor [Ktedonobacterales bacterium]|jgi:selenocysteine-specific elongation factor
MSCIGTAGHVDHGKSTLVTALTGIDPDRLAEEKARGMTIDLGFAWLRLPSGREVSIVDVPGHENFIKNMLAGVGGIDLALLVVAADEGIMPQTEEHLAILDLLRVSRGIVALTKCDLVEEDWRELVREEVAARLSTTTLAGAPILPVSAYSGAGLPELLAELDRLLETTPGRQNSGRPRLPVDRVFTIQGFGTVVTGALLDGSVSVGQEVEILPQGLRARIRSLQTHKTSVETAQPGGRAAMNLVGVAKTDLARGDVISLPGRLRTTTLLDARLQLLGSAPRPLTHNAEVDLYVGAKEARARVRLLESDELRPGERGWAQLKLAEPVAVVRRDRFILRIPSPSLTIGGGEIIDTQPRNHKRRQPAVLAALEILERGAPEEVMFTALNGAAGAGPRRPDSKKSGAAPPGYALHGLQGYEEEEASRRSGLSLAEARAALETLAEQGQVTRVGAFYFAAPVWERLREAARAIAAEHHRQYPLRAGLPREEWRGRLGLSPRQASDVLAALVAAGDLAEAASASAVRLPDHAPRFTADQQRKVDALMRQFHADPFSPPGRPEIEAAVGPDVTAALIDQGALVKISDAFLFSRDAYDEAIRRIVAHLRGRQTITVAEARDLLNTSRKYMLALLEHLDERRITRRLGDDRVLGPASLLS